MRPINLSFLFFKRWIQEGESMERRYITYGVIIALVMSALLCINHSRDENVTHPSKKKIFQYEKQYKCDLHEKTYRDYIFNIPCNGMYPGRAGGYPSQDTIPKH